MNNSRNLQIPEPWSLEHSHSKNADYFFNKVTRQSFFKVPDQDYFAFYFNSSKQKMYFNIKTNEKYTEDQFSQYVKSARSNDEVNTQMDHYNQIQDKQVEDRKDVIVFHLRNMNNWIKSCLLKKYTYDNITKALDFACGKGGDLKKWAQFENLRDYVGVDIAAESVKDALVRYKENKPLHTKFAARFYSADLGAVDLRPAFPDEHFDVVSCQYAFHYFFKSEERLDCAFQSIASLLAPGGRFVCTLADGYRMCHLLRGYGQWEGENRVWRNSICSVEMTKENYQKLRDPLAFPFGLTYNFTLEGSVSNCPEYITLHEVVEKKAHQYGMNIIYYDNCQSFALSCLEDPIYKGLSQKIKVFDKDGTLSRDEWQVVQLYSVLVMEKEGHFVPQDESEQGKRSTIDQSDIIHLN